MKKLLVCLLALCALTFTSCNPDPEPIVYANDYVGEYTLTMTPSLTLVGLDGIELTAVAVTDCEITKISDNSVKIYIYDENKIDCVINGRCDENGLHLENFEYEIYTSEYIEEDDFQLTMIIDLLLGGVTVDKQYNGNISWESPVIVGSLELEAYGETVDGGNVIGSMSYMLVK